MPKRSSRTKLRSQPNVLYEATVRRMLAASPQPKAGMNKKAAGTKLRPQPNVLFEATVRRMLATAVHPQAAVKKAVKKKRG
jgi:ribosomal protein L13